MCPCLCFTDTLMVTAEGTRAIFTFWDWFACCATLGCQAAVWLASLLNL